MMTFTPKPFPHSLQASKVTRVCRYGYHVCKNCCDFNSDCKCDKICNKKAAPNGICSYVPEVESDPSCTCKDLINRHGQGNCQGNPSNVFRGKKICYVNQPTTCPDAKGSRGSNPGEKFSARACYTATGMVADPRHNNKKCGPEGSSKRV